MSVDDGRGVEDSEEGVLDGKNGRGRETRARLVAGGSRSLPTMRRAATQAPAGSPAARHLRPSSASQTVISPAYLLRRTRPRDRPRCLKIRAFQLQRALSSHISPTEPALGISRYRALLRLSTPQVFPHAPSARDFCSAWYIRQEGNHTTSPQSPLALSEPGRLAILR